MRGLPLLYSGDEIGQLNSLAYLQNPEKAADNRWAHRAPMDWARAAKRLQSGTPEHRLFHGLKHLADVRGRQPALDGRGDEEVLIPDNDSLFLAHRRFEDEHLVLAANFSRHWQRATLGLFPDAWQHGHFRDVLTGRRLHFTTGSLVVPPYGCLWLAPDVPYESQRTVHLDVRFRAETEWGESVYLTGNLDALGSWQPDRALGPLETNAYPFWTAEIDVPEGAVFEMKWLRMRDGAVVAESPEVIYGIGVDEEEKSGEGEE